MNGKVRLPGKRWVLLFTLLVLIMTSIPYAVGLLKQGDDWRFTGFVFGVEDGNSYLAKMNRGSAGEWLFKSPYTSTQQKGVIAFLPYILLGKAAVFPIEKHTQLLIIFHLFRLGAGAAMVFATYDFLSVFVKKGKWQRVTLAAIILGGGLGWFLVGLGKVKWLGSIPLEFTSPESFGFLALYGLPHLAMARALLLWGLKAFLVGKRVYIPGLFWILLGFFQPMGVIIAWVVSGMYVLLLIIQAHRSRDKRVLTELYFLKKNVEWLLVNILISSPLIIYTVVKFRMDAYLRAWTSQNQIISPHPAHYFIAYGLMAVFFVRGIWQIRKEFKYHGWLIMGWVAVLPVLVYLPTVIQRRLAEGVWVAIVILAVKAFEGGEGSLPKRWAYTWVLVIPTSVLLIIGGTQTAWHLNKPVFRPTAEVDAFRYLEDEADKNSVILTSHETGNVLPAWVPVHVVLGHGPETANYDLVSQKIESFYEVQATEQDRIQILDEFNVDYVFWGPAEKALGDWDPEEADILSPGYDQGPYKIYHVKSERVE
ncbi:MAG: hypothetical protein KGY46_00770 [Anaerolineales bacterium]|nr:hypothetical protein [Anaerolineales bacterium]